MATFLSAFLPVLVSAAIAAWAAWHAAEKNAKLANVTQERAKWRERIRRLAEELQEAVCNRDQDVIKRLRVAFRVSLNPWDDRDREIVALLEQLADDPDADEILDRIIVRLELLLKHDWERAKAEATWSGSRNLPKPSVRAGSLRAGVRSLAEFRDRHPLAPEFEEEDPH